MSETLTYGQLRATLAAVPGAMDGDYTNVTAVKIMPFPERVHIETSTKWSDLDDEQRRLVGANDRLAKQNHDLTEAGNKLASRLRNLRNSVRSRAPKLP